MERIERETKHPETFDGNFHEVSNWCQRIIMYFDNRKINDSKNNSGQIKMVASLMATKFTCSLTNFSFTHGKSIIQMMEES